MCDVMPTISEDSISQRSSQFGDDANFEQLMVSMLDERDKLVESLKNEQEKTAELEQKVKELEKDRQSLNRQLNQNLPQVIRHTVIHWPVFLSTRTLSAQLNEDQVILFDSKHPGHVVSLKTSVKKDCGLVWQLNDALISAAVLSVFVD